MRRRFWQFVHDNLERAWHWVYYHKLNPPKPTLGDSNRTWQYSWTYVCGKDAIIAPKLPSANDLYAIAEEEKARKATV